jgi:hypothetical protein
MKLWLLTPHPHVLSRKVSPWRPWYDETALTFWLD